MQDNPPGWYRIPECPRFHRYWTGTEWADPDYAQTA
jgi:hypothetical protein